MQEDISIISITDNSILIRYALFNSEKISYSVEPSNIHGALKEANSVGRFEICGLDADKEYKVNISYGDKATKIEFSTLPAPVGKLLCKYAVIGDPHLSAKEENKFGRLHVESTQIVYSVVSRINALNLDFVLSTGDLTECGKIEEYQEFEKARALLKCPFLSIAGNHDFGQGETSYELWEKYFGSLAWQENMENIPIVGLDTHQGKFNTDANNCLIQNLRNEPFFIMLSHYQLFEDEHILDIDKAVENLDSTLLALDEIKDKKGVIYVGHKNVPAQSKMGDLLQINVPQPTHYPCGFLVASVYNNGIYHRFEPIFSEVLNEYSRQETATRNTASTMPEYRDHQLLEKWNFVYK